jgi:chromosome segregation ATPase
MDVEVRMRAFEQRLSEVESAQRDEAAAMRTLFELVQRIDANMTNLVMRVQALETNFSLLNAAVVNLGAKVDALDTRVTALETRVAALETKVDALDAKVTVMDSKLDQILTLLRSPDGARPH